MSRSVQLPAPGPWGFRISGGRDFCKPIAVSKVVAGSKAELAELQPGDVITAINRTDTSDMINMEAQSKIKHCQGDLLLHIDRPESAMPSGSPTDKFVAQRFQTVLHVGGNENDGAWSSSSNESHTASPTDEPQSWSPIISRRPESPVLSPWKQVERTPSPVEPLLRVKNVQTRVKERWSLSPISNSHSESRLIYSANSSPREKRGPTHQLLSPISKAAPDHRALNRIDKDSEVYKMIQENRATKEPPRQSASFRQLQVALDTDQEVAVAQFPSRFSPSATRPAASKYHVCEKCGSSIVTEAVKIRDGCYRHHECYACTDCGLNLGMRGHFWFRDKMFCEKHAQERYQAAEGTS